MFRDDRGELLESRLEHARMAKHYESRGDWPGPHEQTRGAAAYLAGDFRVDRPDLADERTIQVDEPRGVSRAVLGFDLGSDAVGGSARESEVRYEENIDVAVAGTHDLHILPRPRFG